MKDKMKMHEIKEYPTTIGSMHQSLYRSYHILNKVLEMVERDDSKETIFEVAEMLHRGSLVKVETTTTNNVQKRSNANL